MATKGSSLQRLAEVILGDQVQPVKMLGSYSESGNSEDTQDEAWNNPMEAVGDLIAGGIDGSPIRLAAGVDGQVLTLTAGEPAWEDATGGSGSFFRQYLVVDDGAGDWGWVQVTVAGTTRPVTALFELE